MAWKACLVLTLLLFSLLCGCVVRQERADTTDSAAAADFRLTLLTEENPPYNYRDTNGELSGSSTEVIREIQRRMMQDADHELLPWSDGYRRTLAEPLTGLYSTARTPERDSLFRWVGPIESYHFTFYARNGSGISVPSLDAARTAGVIGVVRDDTRHQYLTAQNVTDLALFPDDNTCVRALMNQEIDLWLGSSDTAPAIALQAGFSPGDLALLYQVTKVELFIAFNRETPEPVIRGWQDTLDGMKVDGSYQAILARHGRKAPAVREMVIAPDVFSVPGVAALAALTTIIDQRFSGIARSYEVLAMTDEVRSGDWERIRPLLVLLESSDPSARYWYARPDGSYYTTVDGLASSSLSDRPYFPGVLAGNASLGTVVVSHSTGRSTGIVAVPVMDQDRVTGVLGASVYLDLLSRELGDALPLPATMFFFALDPSGTLSLHSDVQKIGQTVSMQGSPGAISSMQEIMTRQRGTVSYYAEGWQREVTYMTAPITGWSCAIGWITGTGDR